MSTTYTVEMETAGAALSSFKSCVGFSGLFEQCVVKSSTGYCRICHSSVHNMNVDFEFNHR